MAFLVIRTETLLFGLKAGYCATQIWRTRMQCSEGWVVWGGGEEEKAFGMYVGIAVSLLGLLMERGR